MICQSPGSHKQWWQVCMLPRWGKHLEVSKPVQVAQAVGKLQDLNLLPTDSKSVALSIELSLYALAVGYGQRSLSDISCFGTVSSLTLRVSVFKEARTSRTSGSTLALLPLSYGPVKSARQDSNLQPLHSSGLFVRSCRWVRACS